MHANDRYSKVHRMCGLRLPLYVRLSLFSVLAAAPWCAGALGTSSVTVGGVEVDWTLAQTYDVTLTEFHYEPSRIVLVHGIPYNLRLKNTGAFRHTFTAPEFFAVVTFGRREDATEVEESGGSLSLAAGEVREVDLVPSRAGTYPLECTKPLHSLFGMTGDIVVE